MSSFEKKGILLKVAQLMNERRNDLIGTTIVEAGKTWNDSNAEVDRAISTFTVAAEEAVRDYGEYAKLDITAAGKGFSAITKRFPVGVISMIAPFNFPINLVAHKVAPAIAAGCPFVVKPSSRTPLGALAIGQLLVDAGLPQEAFSVLPCEESVSPLFSKADNIKVVSFTGSPKVGWWVKNNCGGHKRVLLELGGNAACVVDKDANIDRAAERILWGAFYYAGQSCISVQRVLLHNDIYDKVREKLVEGCGKLNQKRGDPADKATFLGPLIAESEAVRIQKVVDQAVSEGARIIAGGKRHGNFYDCTIVEDVKPNQDIVAEEIFGPVCVLQRFSDFREAIAMVNDSKYGLQAGVFTPSLEKAFYAYNNIEAGGVVINDVPSVRVDSQPYGGIKASGLGREGLRFAIEEFSEKKIMLLKDIGETGF